MSYDSLFPQDVGDQISNSRDSKDKNDSTKSNRTNGKMNLEQCAEYWEKSARNELHYTSFPKERQRIVTISASNIHGIELFGDDCTSDSFWNQHGRTKADYYELASYIPKIQEKLNAGESIEKLYDDAVLGACARLYFEPRQVPIVIQYKDTFISQGGNRHRILAAQNLGLNIPVKIVGCDNPTTPKNDINTETRENTMPSRDDIKAPNKKKKFSLIQYVILGATLLWLALMYWIAAPSGWLQHLFWFVSAAIPFIPAILLLRAIPRLRNRIGGILLLVLFAVLMLLIQKLYMWVSIAYVVVGTIFVVKNLTDIMPRLYVAHLENADGTTTTETHALSNNEDIADLEVNAIEADYKSRGYTKK